MSTRFEWGRVDCCLWPADAVRAMTGKDIASDFRGKYKTARKAASLLAKAGGLEGLGERAGARIAPLCAGVGDVGVVQAEREVGAVCAGQVWLIASTNGLAPMELRAGLMAWRVGDA